MKQQTHKIQLTSEEVKDFLDILHEHQKNYGTDYVPERITRLRNVIKQLKTI